MDYSDRFYCKRLRLVGNPTHGSAWIVQILSTTRRHGKAGIPRTAVRGFFRSSLQRTVQRHESHARQCVDYSDRFYCKRLRLVGNPTHGTECVDRFSSFLQQALPTSWESHGRQSVDYSAPFYSKRCQPVGNPTHGSAWIIQLLSTASAANQLGIPRTAVGGSFRSFLRHDGVEKAESHARQCVDRSDPFYDTTAWKSRNPTHGRAWIVQILSTTRRRGKGGIPRTAVGGSFRSFLLNGKTKSEFRTCSIDP